MCRGVVEVMEAGRVGMTLHIVNTHPQHMKRLEIWGVGVKCAGSANKPSLYGCHMLPHPYTHKLCQKMMGYMSH